MSSKITFLSRALTPEERKPVPALRTDAIVKRDGKDFAFVVTKDKDGERVQQTAVSVGAKVGDLVRVDGLAPGTRVVAAPTARLADGARVTAARK